MSCRAPHTRLSPRTPLEPALHDHDAAYCQLFDRGELVEDLIKNILPRGWQEQVDSRGGARGKAESKAIGKIDGERQSLEMILRVRFGEESAVGGATGKRGEAGG